MGQQQAPDQLLADAVQLHRSGQYGAAVRLYEKAVRKAPENASARNLLGLAYFQSGRLEEAAEAISKALAQQPELPDAHYNLGTVLQALRRYEDAIGHYRRALIPKPDDVGALNNLGTVLKALGQDEEAIETYRRALAFRPDFVDAHFNLGNALQTLERYEEACLHFERSVALRPNFADAHSNLSNVLRRLDRVDEAVRHAERAVQMKPDSFEAVRALALALHAASQPSKAMACVLRALSIRETDEIKALFGACAFRQPAVSDADQLRPLLARAFAERWARPDDLVVFATNVLKANESFRDWITQAQCVGSGAVAAQVFDRSLLERAFGDRLLRSALESAAIRDIELERALVASRLYLLELAGDANDPDSVDPEAIAFFSALAKQCFINGYIFACADDEMAEASRLAERIGAALQAGLSIPVFWPIAVAAYFPLHSLSFSAALRDLEWPEPVASLLRQQVMEPEQEQQYRTSMRRVTPIDDQVSLAVQQQYEEAPSPRWVHTKALGVKEPLHRYLRRIFPRIPMNEIGGESGVDVLSAGCGTGREPIEIALSLSDARVMAVDVSLASLGYAKRKSEELGLTNIEYGQADILQLGSLERQFDFISVVGVLQCLADPFEGWRVLLGRLRPGGAMRVAMYSEIGRRKFDVMRRHFAERGMRGTVEEIRAARAEIMANKDDPKFAGAISSQDFGTLGDCRDLLFHAHDTTVTIPQIGEFIGDQGLEFLGFLLPPDVMRRYEGSSPGDPSRTDLEHWHRFETENPDTFAGSYRFWVRKPAAR